LRQGEGADIVLSDGYAVIPYDDEHAEAVARLHRFVATPDPEKNAAYLAWKYDRNPYLKREHFYVALHEGKVIGMCAYFGSLWEAGNATQIVPCGAEMIIAPAHRGRGLTRHMLRFEDLAEVGFPIAFSLSAVPKVAPRFLALGGCLVSPVGALEYRTRLSKATQSARRLLGRARVCAGMLHELRTRKSNGANACAARPVEAFARFDQRAEAQQARPFTVARAPRAKAMAALVARLDWDGALRHRRDETYLSWRYQNPLSDYRFLYAGGEALNGYLVLQAARYGEKGPVRIVDWEAASEDLKRRLLDVALDLGAFTHVTAWSFGLTRKSRETLAALGFASQVESGPHGMSVMFKKINDALGEPPMLGGRSLADPAHWQYRMIYSDIC
jgi:GNAT superfamily N-acetyltransferase